MRLSSKSQYAVTAVYHLAQNYIYNPESICNIREIAESEHIPFKFLEQILADLKNDGIVDSKRGINGGYFLVREPAEITVGEVIRSVEGDILPFECTDGSRCIKQEQCSIRQVWVDLKRSVGSVLDTRTFADLVNVSNNFEGCYI